jgi:hypothetical protein
MIYNFNEEIGQKIVEIAEMWGTMPTKHTAALAGGKTEREKYIRAVDATITMMTEISEHFHRQGQRWAERVAEFQAKRDQIAALGDLNMMRKSEFKDHEQKSS